MPARGGGRPVTDRGPHDAQVEQQEGEGGGPLDARRRGSAASAIGARSSVASRVSIGIIRPVAGVARRGRGPAGDARNRAVTRRSSGGTWAIGRERGGGGLGAGRRRGIAWASCRSRAQRRARIRWSDATGSGSAIPRFWHCADSGSSSARIQWSCNEVSRHSLPKGKVSRLATLHAHDSQTAGGIEVSHPQSGPRPSLKHWVRGFDSTQIARLPEVSQ
jgi:hypothetical protein